MKNSTSWLLIVAMGIVLSFLVSIA